MAAAATAAGSTPGGGGGVLGGFVWWVAGGVEAEGFAYSYPTSPRITRPQLVPPETSPRPTPALAVYHQQPSPPKSPQPPTLAAYHSPKVVKHRRPQLGKPVPVAQQDELWGVGGWGGKVFAVRWWAGGLRSAAGQGGGCYGFSGWG